MTHRALVTGASGNIGSRVVRQLVKRGVRTVAVTNRVHPAAERSSDLVSWRSTDLRDSGVAAELVRELSPDLVVHAAWETTHGKFWSSPDNERWAQAGGAMIDAAQECDSCRFVFVGTCAEYSWGSSARLAEDADEAPHSVYGQSKLAVTNYLREISTRGNFDAVSVRVFFPYGPGEASTRLFPYLARQIANRETARIASPDHVRDFCHIDDVADGIVAVAESSLQGVVNLGSGQGVQIRDAAQTFASGINGTQFLQYDTSIADETNPEVLIADTTRLNAVWTPSIELDHGLREYARSLVSGTG